MKLRTALTVTALATLMALPFAAGAQNRGGSNADLGRGQAFGGQQNRNDQRSNQGNQQRQDQQRQDQQRQDQQRQQDNQRRQDQQRLDQQRQQDNQRRQDQQRQQDNQRRQDQQRLDQQRQQDNQRRQDQQRLDQQRQRDSQRRQDQQRLDQQRQWDQGHRFVRSGRDDWNDIIWVSGFRGDLNVFFGDNTFSFDGSAGALYPVWQYDQDLRSQDDVCQTRAAFFARTSFYRDGHRYDRHTVSRNGERYYQFVRGN